MISSKPTPVAAADLLLRPSTSPLLILLHVPTPQGRNPMFFQRYLRLFRKRIIENILVPYISAYLKIKIEICSRFRRALYRVFQTEWWQPFQTFFLSSVLVVAVLGNVLIAFTLLKRKLLRYPSNRYATLRTIVLCITFQYKWLNCSHFSYLVDRVHSFWCIRDV